MKGSRISVEAGDGVSLGQLSVVLAIANVVTHWHFFACDEEMK